MRAVRSPTESTARRALGTMTPAGTGASVNVTRPSGRAGAAAGSLAWGSSSGTRFSAEVPSDSSNGTDSSPKLSSSCSRAWRSGTEKSTVTWSFSSWRTRPKRRVSPPAMPGWRTGSSAVTWVPARSMLANERRCWVPKSRSRGMV